MLFIHIMTITVTLKGAGESRPPFFDKIKKGLRFRVSKEKEQVKKTIDNVQEVVDLFYQQNDKDALEKFMFVLEDMTKAIDNLAAYKNSNPEFVMDEGKIFSILSDAMEALQSDDKVLMADILQYDFIEYIGDLIEDME